MEQFMQTFEQSLYMGISIIVYVAVLGGSIFYTPFDLHLIPKQRRNIYYVLQGVIVYAIFLFVTLLYAHIVPLELFAIDRLTTAYLYTFSAGLLLIVITWIYKAITTRTANMFFTVLVHMVALFPLFLLLLREHEELITSEDAQLLDHLLNLPTIGTLLFYFSIKLYTRKQTDIISYGQVDQTELQHRTLRLLYSLDEQRQVLQDKHETHIHYIYHAQHGTYHRYDIVPRHNNSRKRRAMPSLPAAETATQEGLMPSEGADVANLLSSTNANEHAADTELPPRSTRRR